MVETAEYGLRDQRTRLAGWAITCEPTSGAMVWNPVQALVGTLTIVIPDKFLAGSKQVALREEDEVMEAHPVLYQIKADANSRRICRLENHEKWNSPPNHGQTDGSTPTNKLWPARIRIHPEVVDTRLHSGCG